MENRNTIMSSIIKQLPQKAQTELIPQLEISTDINAATAGTILMGMHILNYVGFAKYVDQLLGEKHTSYEILRLFSNDRNELMRTSF